MKGLRIAFVLAVLAAPAAAQEKVKFEPKFVVSKAFYQQVTTDVTQTVTVQGGTDLKLKHSQTFMFKWLPIKLDGDKWTVELKIEGMKLNVDIATNQVKYDSTVAPDKPDAGNNATLVEFFKNLKETTFTVTFAKGGLVEKVEGRDAFLAKLGGSNPQMEGILKKILTDESLKEMSDPTAGLLVDKDPKPEKAVNDAWEKKTTLPLGPIGSYDRTLKFVYKGKDKVATALELIEATVDLTYKPPAETSDGGLLFRIKAGDLKSINPKAGFFKFDAVKGYVAEAELSVTLKGTLTVALGNNTETPVEVYQEQKTTVKTQDTSFVVIAGPVPGPGVPPIPPKQ